MVEKDAFARALCSPIAGSDLSLTAISHRLRARGRPISIATLSNWRSGRSLPSGEHSLGVLTALEALLDLAQEVGVIDSGRSVQRFAHRATVRALQSGVCRVPVVHVLDADEPDRAPQVTVLEGSSVGPTLCWSVRRTYGVELLVDGRLDAGQVAVLSDEVDLHLEATQVTSAKYSIPRTANDVVLEVEFRGRRRPLECERYRRTEAGESVSPVRLDHRGRLQLSESRFDPGTFGLRWAWGPDEDQAEE
ncbi:XRE family transcriptional regulator [Brachybacterium aquaticum]|uniref:Uncharacterized protein n=1 Tax=Brachybacterium aquaticum TaxID=1432564 RepID=A0A841AH86_9MICO|nr:XRE family transcriptional regulator [Brachybacterium aquaticum]MBB5832650.1 hypothetical protein [Brachybacterium aquaticum]